MPRRRVVLAALGSAVVAGCSGEQPSETGGETPESTPEPSNGDGDGTTGDDGSSGDGGGDGDDDGGDGDDDGGSTDRSADLAVTDPSLVLNWRITGLHAPYFAAQSQGFYEEEGFDSVDIQGGEGSDFSAQQVALGNTEFGISSADQILAVNSGDLSPLAVGIVMQRNPVVIFTAREQFGAELTDPQQLEGLTVGSGPGMVKQMTLAYLEENGLGDSTEWVSTGFDTVQQLLTGEVDAAGGLFSDAVDARQQDYQIDTLSVDEAIPSYGHLVTVGSDFAEENPDTVRAFLTATARGAVWANRNPEAAIDALVEARPELEEVRENQRQKWERMRSGYMLSDAVRENAWGWSEKATWDRTHEILAAGDFFDSQVDPGEVWTNDYLATDADYLGDYADRVDGTF